MKNAWVENGVIRDICSGDPATTFTAEIAKMFSVVVPDTAMAGFTLQAGVWTAPPPAPPPLPPPPPVNKALWLIDIGPFFDRFGASKMPILSSADVTVRAIVQDVMARKWIDLQRVDVAQAIDILISKAITGVDAAMKARILTTPVTAAENLAVVKLYFS